MGRAKAVDSYFPDHPCDLLSTEGQMKTVHRDSEVKAVNLLNQSERDT